MTIRRSHKKQESLIRYWTDQARVLCADIDDPSLLEPQAVMDEALAELNRDRRIIVIGEDGVGKSSLLAALTSCPVMARSPLESPCVRWRFRNQDGDVTNCRFIAEPSLEGLEWVDTQGCSRPGVAEEIRPLLQQADVIIAVVRAGEAEDSSVWGLLAELPDDRKLVCMLALTHSETLSAEALLAEKEKVRAFARAQTSINLSPFCVSPHRQDDATDAFASRVQEMLRSPGGIRSTLHRVVDVSVDFVRKQGRVLNARAGVMRVDNGFLASLEHEIDLFQSKQLSALDARVEAYNKAAADTGPGVLSRICGHFGWVLSPVTLLRLELMGAYSEQQYYGEMTQEIMNIQADSDSQFALTCAGHWKRVRPRMKKTLECDIGEFPEEDLMNELADLRDRMARELYEPFTASGLRYNLNGIFVAQTGWMHSCISLELMLLICAGVLGCFGFDMAGVVAALLAGLIWAVASIAHLVTARRIRRVLGQETQLVWDGLHAVLHRSLEHFLICRMAAYRRLYLNPRLKVAQYEATLEPLQKRFSHININLSAQNAKI